MSGTYNLGYTTLPSFTANSIGYLADYKNDASSTTITDGNPSYFYFIGDLSNSLSLNTGVYMFTFTGILTNVASPISGNFNLLLSLTSGNGYNSTGSITICQGGNYINTPNEGVGALNLCHIFSVTSSKPKLNFTGYYGLTGLSTNTIKYSYALCRIA